jgi:DNA polymerase-3 subunit beta
MLIKVEKGALLRAVTIADSILQGKAVNTITNNCLFSVSTDFIEIISTDNDISTNTTIDCESDEVFMFVCDGKKIAQILKELPDGTVVLKQESNFMNITSSSIHGDYKLVTADGKNFPKIEIGKFENNAQLSQAQFKRMIKKVIFAASHDSIKPVFNGLYILSSSTTELSLVASDSRRLSYIHELIDSDTVIAEGAVVPLKTVNEIIKLLDTGIFEIGINKNQSLFKIGSTTIISRLIDGNFPDFDKVIPKDFIDSVLIENKKFIESLKRVMIFTKEPTFKVILEFNKNSLKIEAKTPEYGEAFETIDIERNIDETIKIGINSQYLMDALKEIESISCKINISGQLSPMTIQPEDKDNYISVIMPIQLKSSE